ncbi:unnamed protein product [Closterium sp. NIES-65]|nr:unnamed protein product [Closterium sp. NIES-65]
MLSDESSIGEGVARLNRWHLGPGTSRVQQQSHAPLHAFYVVGRSLRVLSVFAAYRFLVESDVSVLLFAFFSLLGAAILFFLLQRPWKGKRLTNTQWGISVMNGGVLALAVVTWAYGLKQCGPLRSVMAEYSGAVVATISTIIFGRRGHRVLKLYGAIAMLAAFYLLASGIPLGPTLPPDFPPPANPVPLGLDSTAAATAAGTGADSTGSSTGSSSKGGAAGAVGVGAAGGEGGAGLLAWQVARMSGSGMVEAAGGNPLTAMLLPVAAGVLFALRRLLARLGKSQQKKRLHAVTTVSSVFFLLPIAIFQLSGVSATVTVPHGHGRAVVACDKTIPRRLTNPPIPVLFPLLPHPFPPPHTSPLARATRQGAQALDLEAGGRGQLSRGFKTFPSPLTLPHFLHSPLACATRQGAQALDLEAGGRPMQVYALVILAGLVFSFYVDTLAEDKLRIGPSSLKHLLVTSVAVVALLLIYRMHFSPLSFVLIALLLAAGLHWSTAIERSKSAGSLAEDGVAAKERRRTAALAMLQGAMDHVMSDSKSRRIALFLLINAAFMIVEFSVGFLSNSLGLISDACHMLFDCAALAIGLYASYISRLDSPSKFAYGYGRFEVLSGFVNAVFLVLIAALIVFESIERILDPPDISTANLLAVSVGGLVVNMVGLVHGEVGAGDGEGGEACVQEVLTSGSAHVDHNMHGIFLHVLADTLGSVGVVISTLLIKYKGWMLTDPACSIFISALIISTVIPLLQNSAEIILQRVPRAAEHQISAALKKIESMAGVVAVRQRHFWSFTPKMLVGSIHVLISPDSLKNRAEEGGAAAHNGDAYSEYGDKQRRLEAVQQLRQLLRRRVSDVFRAVGITHVTVEIEEASTHHLHHRHHHHPHHSHASPFHTLSHAFSPHAAQ